MPSVGKVFVLAGLALIAIGGLIMVVGRSGVPLGRLPGDIVYRGKNTTVYFPIVTCVVLSIVLSVIAYVVGRLR